MSQRAAPRALSAAAAAGWVDLAEAVCVERVRVQDDRRALAGKRLGDRAPDAVRRARHQRPLVLEQQPLRATLHVSILAVQPCVLRILLSGPGAVDCVVGGGAPRSGRW
jgi:hypothetical protein